MELWRPTEDEFGAFIAVPQRGFGSAELDDEAIGDLSDLWELDRSIGVMDHGRWVAASGIFSLGLTVPGGAILPTAGITEVGVEATHRRRGLLRSMMECLIADAAERREPLAALTASEGSIYGRFGFGWATEVADVTLDTRTTTLARPPAATGRLERLDRPEAAPALDEAYEACRRTRSGTISRGRAWWDHHLKDRPAWREGASGLYLVVHRDDDGRSDGLVTYRHRPGPWRDAIADVRVEVVDLVGVDPEVEADLWSYLLGVDLAPTIHAPLRPVDDPIRWRLTDPRQVRTRAIWDYLWVRVLDVAAALEARTYRAPIEVAIEVDDPFHAPAAGTWALTVASDGTATVAATDRLPDLTLGAGELGSLYLGGVGAVDLARAGRVTQHTPGTVEALDRAMREVPAPHNATMF